MPGPELRSRSYRSRRRPEQEGFCLRTVFLGAGGAMAVGLLLALVCSVILRLSPVDEKVLDRVVDVGSFVALGLTTFAVGRRVRTHGLMYGAAIGLAYCAGRVFLGLALPSVSFKPGTLLVRLLLLVLVGSCAGVLGVNL